MSLHQFRLFSKLKNTHFLINYYGDAQNEYNVFNPPPKKPKRIYETILFLWKGCMKYIFTYSMMFQT